MSGLDLDRDGAALLPGAARPVLAELETALADIAADQAGVRIHGHPVLGSLLGIGSMIGSQVDRYSPAPARPVRAILFDKSAAANWSLGWHQDRTIALTARHDVTGFGPWTIKQGIVHAEPPFSLIERMRTIRIHFDPVDADNAPLRIALGSHRLGKLAERDIDAVVSRGPIAECLAERGDVWVYATSILHASAAAAAPRHRRVLQVDYSIDALPAPLEWLGL